MLFSELAGVRAVERNQGELLAGRVRKALKDHSPSERGRLERTVLREQ